MVLACAALFWVQRLAPTLIAESFFAVWGLSLLYAILRQNNYQTNRQLLGASGVVLSLVPVVDAFTLERHLFNSLGEKSYLTAIDITLMLIGVLLSVLAWRLPSSRMEETHKQRGSKTEEPFNDDVDDDYEPALG
ncbi:MAG: hypothetical protein JKY66_06140 [Spongiibacteraceae bacterium]|nr:hypothetical protein [Spongiibacteraceae bacterium]